MLVISFSSSSCSWIGLPWLCCLRTCTLLPSDVALASQPCLCCSHLPKAEIGGRTISYLREDVAIAVRLLSSEVCLYVLGHVVPRVAQFYHHVAIQPPLGHAKCYYGFWFGHFTTHARRAGGSTHSNKIHISNYLC